MKNFEILEKKIGYTFKDKKLLKTALTHSSYLNESENKSHSLCNERMEFLGDSILGMCVAEYLYFCPDELLEGKMSKLRAKVVCENTLSEVAKKWDLGDFLYLSHGEDINGGRQRKSILSDCVESLIAGIYLDSTIDFAKKFVLDFIKPYIHSAMEGSINEKDYKTELQEYLQSVGKRATYELLSQKGPDHAKIFESSVIIDGEEIAKGEGSTKKKSEQSAAKNCMKILKEEKI